MVVHVLTRKLWRTIRSTRGQFAAVAAVVAVGIAVYVSMASCSYNLFRSKESFYRTCGFADYYFHVTKAPEGIVRQIEAVPGVAAATGRIQKDVPVIKADGERATARLTSYPLPVDTGVNRLRVLSGRLFEAYPENGAAEVLLDPQYAAANHLSPGDTVTIVAGGKQVPLTVVGTATSPEFIYPMKDPASLIPEPETFGIFMVPHNQAQQILNLPGQINQVVIKMVPGADEKKVAERVRRILEPCGNLASYPRRQQLSDAVLQGELEQLRVSARFLPSVFLGIAALVEFVILGRMVRAQRLQIGTLKALGYNNLQLMLHYTGYALMVSLAGTLPGTLLGVLFASSLTREYARYFNLPEVIGGVNPAAICHGFLLSLSVGAAAGLVASRRVLAVRPAESMRPEPPRGGGRVLLENWRWLWSRLDTSWKMGLRSMSRNRFRSAVTLLGLIFATGMLVLALFFRDTVDSMVDRYFYRDRPYDYLIRFSSPVREPELLNIARLDGVVKAEPFLEIPARLHFMGRSQEEVLVGLPPGAGLKKLWSTTGHRLELPDEGLLISYTTSRKLGARVGDTVEVETFLGLGPSRRRSLRIAGINREFVGGTSYIALEQANRVLQENRLISGAMLKVDPGRAEAVEEQLNKMTGISSILGRQKELEQFNARLGYMFFFIAVMVGFAVILGFAIVYNSSVMSFSERRRELPSLRVMGFTAREVATLLLKESLVQTLLGVALGLPFGRLLSEAYIRAMTTTELYASYNFQVVIYPLTYVLSSLGGIFFITVAYRLAVRNVSRLDLVEVLKTRD